MTDEQIKHMVDRFLMWKLPENFHPDGGISFQRLTYGGNVQHDPVGTNLLSATDATEMVRYMVEGMPEGKFSETWCRNMADAEAGAGDPEIGVGPTP